MDRQGRTSPATSFVSKLSVLLLFLLCGGVAYGVDVVTELQGREDFERFIGEEGNGLVMFYAQWCYRSSQFMPELAAAARLLMVSEKNVRVAQIDVSIYPDVGITQSIDRYPSLRLYEDSLNSTPIPPLTKTALVQEIHTLIDKDALITKSAHLDELLKPDSHVIVLGVFLPNDKNNEINNEKNNENNMRNNANTRKIVRMLHVFTNVARDFQNDILFAHTTDETIANEIKNALTAIVKKTNIKINANMEKVASDDITDYSKYPPQGSEPYVAILTPFESEFSLKIMDSNLESSYSLKQFVYTYQYPPYRFFTEEVANRIFTENRPIVFLLTDTSNALFEERSVEATTADTQAEQGKSDIKTIQANIHSNIQINSKVDTHKKVVNQHIKALNNLPPHLKTPFTQLSLKYRSKLFFALSGNTEPQERRLAGLLGLEDEDLPAVRIIAVGWAGQRRVLKKYKPQLSSLEPGNVQKFIASFISRSIQPYFKSETIPEYQPGPTKVVVGNTFQSEVIDVDEHVFIEFYAPWCGHCRTFESTLNELAALLKKKPISVAKMDATANDIDRPFVGFPTLLLYRKGQKNRPIEYSGERQLKPLLTFIRQNTDLSFDVDTLLNSDKESDSPLLEEL